MWHADDPPVLELWLQGCICVVVAHNTRRAHGNIGHCVNDVCRALLDTTIGSTTVCDVVHPGAGRKWEVVPIGLDEALMLAWVPIVATWEVASLGWTELWQWAWMSFWQEGGSIADLSTIDAFDNPPITLELVKSSEILHCIGICCKTVSIIGIDGQAFVALSHALNHMGVHAGCVSGCHLTDVGTAWRTVAAMIRVRAIQIAFERLQALIASDRTCHTLSEFWQAMLDHAWDVWFRHRATNVAFQELYGLGFELVSRRDDGSHR